MLLEHLVEIAQIRSQARFEERLDLLQCEQGILQILLVLTVVFAANIIAKTFFPASAKFGDTASENTAEKTSLMPYKPWASLVAIALFLILRQPPIEYAGYVEVDLFIRDAIVVMAAVALSVLSLNLTGPEKILRIPVLGIVLIQTLIVLAVGYDLFLSGIFKKIDSMGLALPPLLYLVGPVVLACLAYKAVRSFDVIVTSIKKSISFSAGRVGLMADLIERLIVNHTYIPDRIYKHIEIYQNKSETYIALFQFLLIGLFLLIYLTLLSGLQDVIIPMTMLVYAFLVGNRLYLAKTGQLTQHVIILSIVADYAILMAYIWSMHIQFEAAPLTYLKGLGLYYMFILMALRTLSFQPLHTLVSGLCAAVSWGLLLTYAVMFHTGAESPLAETFMSSLQPDKIFLKQELAKIGIIGLVTFLLILSQAMARKILIESLQAQGNISDLSHFFDHNVVRKIITRKQDMVSDIAETKNATIMFIDLRSFTDTAAQMSPPDVIQVLRDYQSRIVPVIEKHGGSIDKFMGDGILASFGAFDEDHKSYTKDAMVATKEIMDVHSQVKQNQPNKNIAQINDIGIGLATGDVIVGVIGNKSRYEYTVIGDAVNKASKYEKHTKDAGVKLLCDDATYQKAKAQGFQVPMVSLENQHVEGVKEPQNLWTFEGLEV